MFISLFHYNRLNLNILIAFIALFVFSSAWSQHRGDDLAFQGISEIRDYDVKAIAMGNAFTSMSGELASLYYNPAGLSAIENFAFSVSVNNYGKKWHENQEYRPNRLFVTLPFYLEGLYTPDPANIDPLTGLPIWDDELAIDTSYQVRLPDTGLEPFSGEAADWVQEKNGFALNSIAIAYPFRVMNKKMTISAAYKNDFNVLDFDRNDTYLDPHLGYTRYNMPERVTGLDTVRVDWYRFLRQRTGDLQSGRIGFGLAFSKRLHLGMGLNLLRGESEDRQYLNKYGYFDLADQNSFRFGFDSLKTQYSGSSTFSAISATIGGIYNFDDFSIGINILLPRTISREWEYTQTITDSAGSAVTTTSGEDKAKLPAQYSLGFHLTPTSSFLFSFDYQFTHYSASEFEFADNHTDTTHNAWMDQHILRFGAGVKLSSALTLMAGYQYLPQTFLPDGSAFKDRGPAANSYSMGLSLELFDMGRLDVAYEIRRLKYYDQYMSNINYNVINLDNLSIGYTYIF
ncbi:hypothetical protein GF407_03135 [candidate division KSB1 bacterium]|nr:hypothetical protein [candidate division KSB1 bacterium]